MSKILIIKKKIDTFKKVIKVSGDKRISIRWVLFSSLADGTSTAKNLLMSEDVVASLKAIKSLESNLKLIKIYVKFMEKELMVMITKKLNYKRRKLGNFR